jgi:hypothetical protein
VKHQHSLQEKFSRSISIATHSKISADYQFANILHAEKDLLKGHYSRTHFVLSRQRLELRFTIFSFFMAGLATKDSGQESKVSGMINMIETHSC